MKSRIVVGMSLKDDPMEDNVILFSLLMRERIRSDLNIYRWNIVSSRISLEDVT